MRRAKILRFEKVQAQRRQEEKQMFEKGRREKGEVKTLCEVEEDPREAIKRRERFA